MNVTHRTPSSYKAEIVLPRESKDMCNIYQPKRLADWLAWTKVRRSYGNTEYTGPLAPLYSANGCRAAEDTETTERGGNSKGNLGHGSAVPLQKRRSPVPTV